MKMFATVWMVLVCAMAVFAAAPNGSSLEKKSSLTDPRIEIAELERLIAATKESGFPVDPSWTERLLELRPLAKNHPGNVRFDLPAADLTGGFAPGAVIRPTELTQLEQQIHELESQIDGGFSAQEPDEITRFNLKDRLNELYAQREVRDPANPLDQGNDACPATVISGLPFTDTGTTTGQADNYNPAQLIGGCFNNFAPDVIYSFVAPYTQSYTISTDGSSFDTYLYIQTGGACPGTTTVECDDDDGVGLQSLITRVLNAGETYYIIVDGYSSASGNYVLNVFDNCNVDCQPGDIQECFETRDSTHAQVNCNGGCENPIYGGVESWQDIQPCQTVCGRFFTYIGPNGSNSRDVDVYRVTLAEACSLAFTVNSEVGYQIYVLSGSCPWDFLWNSAPYVYPCSTATIISTCLPAGTYSVVLVPTAFSGIDDFRTYRMRLDLIPCSGCRIDAAFTAPASVAWNTCGAGNDNSLRPSEDYTYCVNIPYDGDWTFSTCNDDSIWDSYIYLSTACNGGVIAQDDDACGGIGLSTINCVSLTAGTYYLTVEGWSSFGCGPFVLNVSQCLGSCCYGDPLNPSCDYIGPNACGSLGGLWTSQEPCSSGACFTRPECNANALELSQTPVLPDEVLDAPFSDAEGTYRAWESYSTVTSEIGAVRFWGFWADGCLESPAPIQLQFVDSVNNTSQTYNLSLTETATGLTYLGFYPLYQYDAVLFPPCEITTGWLSVYGNNPAGCYFTWCNSPFGDGTSVQTDNGNPVNVFPDLAFCLNEAPCDVDSLTYIWSSPGTATLRWYQSQSGAVTIWFTTDPNLVYPAGWASATFGYAAGNNSIGTNADLADNVRVILTLNCTPAAAAAAAAPPAVLDLRDAQK